jgi:hypothetical protein
LSSVDATAPLASATIAFDASFARDAGLGSGWRRRRHRVELELGERRDLPELAHS